MSEHYNGDIEKKDNNQISPKETDVEKMSEKTPVDKKVREKIPQEIVDKKELPNYSSIEGFYKFKHESFLTITKGLLHDLNNYFSPILANLSLLKMNTSPNDKNYDRICSCELSCIKAVDYIKKLTLINETPTLSKELASISELVESSVDLIISGTNVKCVYIMGEDLKPVEVDKNKLVQALYNIVKIFRDNMKEGGTINVKIQNFVLNDNVYLPLEDKEYIQISIDGDGVEVDMSDIQFNADEDLDSEYNINALGLTMAFNILKEHGGFFDIDSINNKDTKVYLYLPTLEEEVLFLENPQEIKEGPPDEKDKDKFSYNVLVMDDNEIVAGTMADMLMEIGCNVYIANDGEQAIKIYSDARDRESGFDIAILDLIVPGGQGAKEIVESLKMIKSDVKLIVSSGTSDHPVMKYYKNFGFDAFIKKPININDLRTLLDGLFKK